MDRVKEKNFSKPGYVGNSPLFIYSLFYLSGIIFGNSQSYDSHLYLYFSVLFIIITLTVYYFNFYKRVSNLDVFLKLMLGATLFVAGNFNISQSPYAKKNLYSNLLKKEGLTDVRLVVKSDIKINRNYSTSHCFSPEFNEGVLLYLDKKAKSNNFEIGDTIITQIRLREISNPNGSSFDRKGYYMKMRVFSQGYLREGYFTIVKPKGKTAALQLKSKMAHFIKELRESAGNQEWADMIIAITTGDKSYLDRESKDAFISSGTMHLMAVSGLHAGFLFIFISFILSFMGNRLLPKILRSIAIISTLWLYCAIAGFSPSSLRAVIMISMLTIYRLIGRSPLSLNSLCASALLITLFSPESLYEPGFQLSYIAFLSILFINPKIDNLVRSENKIVKWFWGLISISIACQIGTSLISISLFGFFPLYFLIANILLMPLSAIVIYICCCAAILWLSGFGYNLLFKALEFTSKTIYYIAARVESLPYSKIDADINSGYRLIIIALILVLFVDFGLERSRKRYICAGLIINALIVYLLS
ncbi:MAG: ComEC/Rec2 family competence protein [Bacteroidales bacterium]|nr:ComEC/Rec2 family competence protein [Bacteroidales bacterium]